ncbi:hypothetical protein QBC38DRAFT_445467 [Podospora fimiseda]|uniref:Uncharacterized protein n=1 Tax=Podospora fimiseda TaxID=252190 RepID=A0AAN7BLL2_9PEZI|nr:hypothetical protein QBC38DRAFT_445467 [Podospora fimiseda]
MDNKSPSRPTQAGHGASGGSGDQQSLSAAREFQNQARGSGSFRGASNSNTRPQPTSRNPGGPFNTFPSPCPSHCQKLTRSVMSGSSQMADSWGCNPRPAPLPPGSTVRSPRRPPSPLRNETSFGTFLESPHSPTTAPPPLARRNILPSAWNLSAAQSPPPPTLSELRALNLSSNPQRMLRGYPASLDIVSTKLVRGTGPAPEQVITSPIASSFQVPDLPESPTPRPRLNSNNSSNQPPSLTTTPSGTTSTGGATPRNVTIPNVLITGPSPPKESPNVLIRSPLRVRAASEPLISPSSSLTVQAAQEGTPTRQRRMGMMNFMPSGLRNVVDLPESPYCSPSLSGSVVETIKEEPEDTPDKNWGVQEKTEGDFKGKGKERAEMTRADPKPGTIPTNVTQASKPNPTQVSKVNTAQTLGEKKKETKDPSSRVFYYQSTDSPPEAIKEQYRRFEEQRNVSLATGSGEGVAKVDVAKQNDDPDEDLKQLVDAEYPDFTLEDKGKLFKLLKRARETKGKQEAASTQSVAQDSNNSYTSGWSVSRRSSKTGEMVTRPFAPAIRNYHRPPSPTKQNFSRNTTPYGVPSRPSSPVKPSFPQQSRNITSTRPTSPTKQQSRNNTPFDILSRQASPSLPSQNRDVSPLGNITSQQQSQPQNRNLTPLQPPPSRPIQTLSPLAPTFVPSATPTMSRLMSLATVATPGDILERNEKLKREMRNVQSGGSGSQGQGWSPHDQKKRDFSGESNNGGWSEDEEKKK